ncbi:MAG: tRNA pseudouridine(55) synthase TruB [Betaproteobacteria bacterium]
MAATGSRSVRRPVHGVLLLDKPVGLSSQDALYKAKRLLRAEKAGHTGTLDPLASGLLPLCFGAATKFAQVSLEADKAYRATLHLGQTRMGGDREGEVLRERPVAFDEALLHASIERLTGDIEQVPPMQSALKHQGKALYEYARAGIEIERKPRRVHILRLEVVKWSGPTLVLDVQCSKGTYVRTLAEDLGEMLGCGAHLSGLRRTASGPLRVEQAVSLEALSALDEPARDALLRPADALLQSWPEIRLPDDEAGRFLSGLRRRVRLDDMPAVRVYGPQPRAFLGSAHITGGELIADRLLSPVEVQALLAEPSPP